MGDAWECFCLVCEKFVNVFGRWVIFCNCLRLYHVAWFLPSISVMCFVASSAFFSTEQTYSQYLDHPFNNKYNNMYLDYIQIIRTYLVFSFPRWPLTRKLWTWSQVIADGQKWVLLFSNIKPDKTANQQFFQVSIKIQQHYICHTKKF